MHSAQRALSHLRVLDVPSSTTPRQENRKLHWTLHFAALVPKPEAVVGALTTDTGRHLVSQLDMYSVEDLGLVKIANMVEEESDGEDDGGLPDTLSHKDAGPPPDSAPMDSKLPDSAQPDTGKKHTMPIVILSIG